MADKTAVLAFCQHTWEWGDYLAEVYDRWLESPDGQLLVGDLDGRPVAVGHVMLVAPGEAWLQGMRVDPDHRRAGLARHFTEQSLTVAAALGARVARLATLATNVPIHRIMEQLCFHHVGGFVSYHADTDALTNRSVGDDHVNYAVLNEADFEELVQYLSRSPVFAAMGGLHCTHWTCHELSPAKLRARMAAGEVLAHGDCNKITAIVIVSASEDPEQGVVVDYADGQEKALAELAAALVSVAAKQGQPSVGARLPDVPCVLAAFQQAGYVSDGHAPFWVFEKLTGGP